MAVLRRKTTTVVTATLKDQNDNAVTGATVTATLVDADGAPVSGQSWPLTLQDQGDGTYTGKLDEALDVSEHDELTLQVTAVIGSNQAYAELPMTVVVDDE